MNRGPPNVLLIGLTFGAWLCFVALLLLLIGGGGNDEDPRDPYPLDPQPEDPGPAVPSHEPEVTNALRRKELAE